MNESAGPVTIALRIPGKWSHPKEIIGRLPEGCGLTPDTFTLPDGTEIGFGAAKADKQFAGIFRSSCRQPPTDDELATVDGYTCNAFLMGPGGSLQTAHTMMRAAAAIIHAGGAGVFIDNSGLAHGGQIWLGMTEDGGSDALSFAFVSIIRGKTKVWTMGMHTLGLREIVMKRADVETGGHDPVEMIRYMACGEHPVENGHIIADLDGPRFQVFSETNGDELAGSPMHNPFGRLRLVNMRDLAETN